jgi:aminoglycoside phosphotransferase (APT) family kinase protein
VAQIVAEINRLRSQINDMAVCRLVTSLSGKTCTIQHSDKVGQGALMGGSNYHARVLFGDGSSPWLLRVPRVASYEVGLPESLVEHLVRSEYATLTFLENTKVPAPRAYGYGIRGRDKEDHGVGVSFLLMEHLPGEAWTGEGTKEQKAKVLSGLASILNEVAQHPFTKAGSLVPHASTLSRVSAVASDRFLALTHDGPFDDAESYYASFAEQYLALICGRQLYTEYPVDAYLVYRFLKDNVSQLASRDANGSGEFFLKHVDDKGDHILIDENFNITGIIDWEMARTVPRSEAFGPSLVTADMNDLCAGKVCLTENDQILARELGKLSPQLADCSVDEKARRFFWGLALEPDWADAKPLAVAILTVFGVDQRWEEWREHALKRYGGDGRLQRLLRGCS